MYLHRPALWFFSGGAFFDKIGYVYPRDSGGGDGFNVHIFRGFIVGALSGVASAFVFASLIFMRRWTPDKYIKRIKIMALTLTIIPTGTFLACLVAMSRITIDMGITPKRLMGIGFFTICIVSTISAFYLLLQKNTKCLTSRCT